MRPSQVFVRKVLYALTNLGMRYPGFAVPLMFASNLPKGMIKGRSQTSYIALCNGVISHWAQIGGLRVFANHTRKHKRKNNITITIFAHRVAFYACSSSRMQVTYESAQVFFIAVKTRRPPLWAPCRNRNGAGSGIFLVYLWIKCKFLLLTIERNRKMIARSLLYCIYMWISNQGHIFKRLIATSITKTS